MRLDWILRGGRRGTYGNRPLVGRRTFKGVWWVVFLVALILAWRNGLLPRAVYEGKLRDVVLAKTGFDLADRKALDRPKITVDNVHGVAGAMPAVEAEFVNEGTRPITKLQAVASFHTGSESDRWVASRVVNVAGGDQPPLGPGERRTVRLASRSAFDPKTLLGRPAPILADLYYGAGGFNADGSRRRRTSASRRNDEGLVDDVLRASNEAPELTDIVVRR